MSFHETKGPNWSGFDPIPPPQPADTDPSIESGEEEYWKSIAGHAEALARAAREDDEAAAAAEREQEADEAAGENTPTGTDEA